MQRVIGIGGVFFKSKDPQRLYAWYEKHLGMKPDPMAGGAVLFRWSDDKQGDAMTVWSIFPESTKYFEPSQSSLMINYRVADLDALVEALRQEGVAIEKREDADYGRFAWIMDPDGNRIELWEPPKGTSA
jgi:catechol 2,3-dioxygenase-like lactoylglutathione lyase family enzyme